MADPSETARPRPPAGYSRREHHWRRLRTRIANPHGFRRLQQQRVDCSPDGRTLRSFDEFRCIFVHIPKCAGVSVCRSLFGNLCGGHKSLRTYQVVYSPEEFTSYFKFAFVRNPWDRVLSAFLFLKKGGINRGDELWATETLSGYRDFDEFVRNGLRRKEVLSYKHFRPQCDFVCLKGTQPGVDFIGRYENLAEDFATVCRALNVQATLLEANRNTSRQKDYREYYTAEARQIVGDVYADDIKLFGYSFGA